MAEVCGARELGRRKVDDQTISKAQDSHGMFEEVQVGMVKNGELDSIWNTTNEKLLENLLARINALSNKVVQVDDKMRRLSNVLEYCGETQSNLFHIVSTKQYKAKKVARKRKSCTKNTLSQDVTPDKTCSADLSPQLRSTLDSLAVCESNETIGNAGLSMDSEIETEEECPILPSSRDFSGVLRNDLSKGGDPRPQMQTDCPNIDVHPETETDYPNAESNPRCNSGFTPNLDTGRISPDGIPKKRKRTGGSSKKTLIGSHADDNVKIAFGKYKGKTFRFVFTNDCQYVKWAMIQPDPINDCFRKDINFIRFVKYARAQSKKKNPRPVDTKPLKQFHTRCMNGASCDRFGCYFVHPPERRPECEKGEYCTDKSCQKLHPTIPCKMRAYCIKYDCHCLHPPERRRKCELGWDCTDPSCLKLHPRR